MHCTKQVITYLWIGKSLLNHEIEWSFNSLPNNKILDQSKYKAFADDKGDLDGKICSG